MKKKLIFSAALVLSLGLAGCGEDKAKEEPKKEVTQQPVAEKENAQKEEKKVDDNEVKNGPLTKPGQWTMDGESKVTLVKITDPKQTYDIGPVKLTIDSVKLLKHSNVSNEVSETIKNTFGKDINGELNAIQIKYKVENTIDTNVMFHTVDTLTTDTKAQIKGINNIGQNTDNGTYMGKVEVEGLAILPYFNGDLDDINIVNIITGDVWENDKPNKLSESQKIEISF
ncbi:lipoprotein [Lysinibacillus sp. Ag94]|uniref:LptM family lipoprotein n=1 Tax=Lysinibacillus sp. Ag94 TaxID=2936682 RepID=UPI00200E085E|nr:hypothetical protein [Lysinibacillus sp. Ag94]UPW82300.1 hypothetical protein MY533_16330 [Lysinibacillus sp. Ag94]